MTLTFKKLGPWTGPIPNKKGRLGASLILPVPLDPSIPVNLDETVHYLEILRKMMSELFPGQHEILLAPFGERQPAFGQILDRLSLATSGNKNFRWIKGHHPGPGAAVREAVFLSHGQKIIVGNLECQYEPSFFKKALRQLGPTRVGIQANRRLPDSEFTVSVTSLSLVYRRHLLGAFLNHFWSRLFRLNLTDSLSGAYALQRDFALRAFNRVTCSGFLYESEISIIAQVNQLRLNDLPSRFFLVQEKKRSRVYREIFEVFAWTWRFLLGRYSDGYRFLRLNGNHLTADDWGISPAVNDGILEMAKLGHLRRISVMAGSKYMNYRLRELKRVQGIEFGLHFNLTYPAGGAPFASLKDFLWAWYKTRWSKDRKTVEEVRRSLRKQFSLLRHAGIRAARVEGHHHVHAVPGLLGEIIDILQEEGVRHVRVPYHHSLWFGSKAPVAWLARGVRKTAQRFNLSHDPFYYPSRRDFSSFNRLVRILNHKKGTEIIIHPAHRNDIAEAAPSDNYRQGRVREFNLLRLLALELRSNSND